jgi:hypothetical protein
MATAKRGDPTREALDAIRNLGVYPDAEALRPFLGHKSNHVVAAAAKLAQKAELRPLTPALAEAAERLMADPAKLDKTNTGLNAIYEALYQLDYAEPGLYLRGIRHVQMEGSFGPPVDVGAWIRAQSALGLVRSRHPEALALVTDLLVDPEPQARIGAAQALALGGEAGALVLRLKIRTGDKEADVLAECYSGLLAQHYAASIGLITKCVEAGDEQAMLALGATRKPEAFAILKRAEGRIEARATLYLAIATLRTPEACEYLEAISREGDRGQQAHAQAALALFGPAANP